MRYKTKQQEHDHYDLKFENVRLWMALYAMDKMSLDKFGIDLMITSIFRDDNDPYGLHRNMRAADVRIWNEQRDGAPNGTRPPEITETEMVTLAAAINKLFDYGRTGSGRKTETVKVRLQSEGHHEDKQNDHAHVQTRSKGAWT